MTAPHDHPRAGHPDDNFSEFAEELRLLAEAVLERVEPVLRRTAADGRTQWSSCAWCPVCAAAAVVRGEHHDVVAAIADHGTAIVTVLREALAGVPVEPVLPPDLDPESPEYQAWLHDSFGHGDFSGAHAGRADTSEGQAAPDDPLSTEASDADSAAPGARGSGAHTGPSAALAGLIARFAAGAAGVASERRARAAGEPDQPDSGASGNASEADTGAPNRAETRGRAGAQYGADVRAGAGVQGASGRGAAPTNSRSGDDAESGAQAHGTAAGPEAADPFGRGPGTARRPGDRASTQAGGPPSADGGDQAVRSGQGATRAGYVPINVTIKA
ncbi:MAG: Epstein-Barr nuclear antigen [Nocardia sp.]|uniref:hypothetical protein n=1 Tax=Nocardia sp. TaxID=1821 RepID=UPI00260E06C2|nr:hypothetical protein [Nocardia sp.]MCU1640224.1 Epstein-Barr nuclear antigen [Nocardia sp.]